MEDKVQFEVMEARKKKPLVLQAESDVERTEWVNALQEGISDSLNSQELSDATAASASASAYPQPDRDKESAGRSTTLATATSTPSEPKRGDQLIALRVLSQVPGNEICADCGAPEPTWASINLGILVCLECSGVHRRLGTHVSKVRSLTLDKWEPELLLFMKSMGNIKSNEIFERTAGVRPQFTHSVSREGIGSIFLLCLSVY
jgi:hypothetical protein